MSLVRLQIKGISYSQTQNGAYALILNEVEGERKLPIVIGAFEAQSIAIALEKEIKPPRPLTHDLFKNFADRFQIVIKTLLLNITYNVNVKRIFNIRLTFRSSDHNPAIIEKSVC